MEKINRLALGLVLVRIMSGVSMLVYGIAKATDLQSTLGFFGSMGVPTFMTYLVITIDIVGGIFMIGGVLVPLVALGFVCVLATSMVMLGLDLGFAGGYELELVLLISSIAVGLACFDKNKKIFNFIPSVV